MYAEPFFGSGALLLARPGGAGRHEIVCDSDGLICNFWRSVIADPHEVARHATWPTIHQDLTARRIHMAKWVQRHRERLSEDPRFHDSEMAGWWVWGVSLWIGAYANFIPDKPPGDADADVAETVPATVDAAEPDGHVSDIIPVVCASPGGRGVSAQRTRTHGTHLENVERHILQLAERLRCVIVLNRDWTSGVTPAALMDNTNRSDLTRAVVLDPPYLAERQFYGTDTESITTAAYRWAVEHGDRYRVAYCCNEGDYPVPDGWTSETQTYRSSGKPGDTIMFSPACVSGQLTLF